MKLYFKQKGKPDIIQAKTKLVENLNKLWRGAIKAFVSTIVLNDIVKVDTGMARATLLPLARAVRMFTMVSKSIKPKRQRPGYSIAGGEAYGEDAYDIKFATKDKPILDFIFKVELTQYIIRELGLDYNHDTPAWRSLEKGKIAFDNYIHENYKSAFKLTGKVNY